MLKTFRENTFLKLFLVSVVFCMFLALKLNADEFDEVNNILNSADTGGKKALGTGIKWAFGIVLPLICIVSGMILGYTQQKKKSEQEQNTNKIYVVTAISGIVGFFVFTIVSMVVSRALFGDSTFIFQVINDFYKEAIR